MRLFWHSIQLPKELSMTQSFFPLRAFSNQDCYLFREVSLLYRQEELARIGYFYEQVLHMIHDMPEGLVIVLIEGTSHDLIALFGSYPVLVYQIGKLLGSLAR